MPNTTKLCRVAIKDRDRAAIEDCCRQPAQRVVQEKISATCYADCAKQRLKIAAKKIVSLKKQVKQAAKKLLEPILL
jgi:hypothetical protein